MLVFRYSALLLLALPLLPLACGGSSNGGSGGGGSGGGGSTPVEQGEAPSLFAALICDNIGPCCSAQNLDYKPEACKALYTAALKDQWDAPNTRWDADAAGRCANLVRQALATCSDIPGNDCQDVIDGTLAPGATCSSSAECAKPAGGGLAYCDEICFQEPRGKSGDSCSSTCTETPGEVSCSGGGSTGGSSGPASCYTNDGLFCTDTHVCAPLLKLGDPCSYEGCPEGSFCSDQVCVPTMAVGASCSSSDACGATGYCDSNTNACAPKKPVGADCVEYDECLEGYCNSSDKCPASGPASEQVCSGQ